jgi:thiol-disulfide isomerase/thioredoxin
MNFRRLLVATSAFAGLCSTSTTMAQTRSAHLSTEETLLNLPVEGYLPSLDGANGWLNSRALSPAALRGKVVLIDFWTYTCINWLHTAPYVRAWAEKYKDLGLVVIGVHSPEFAFERDLQNVVAAAKSARIDYPVAIDGDHVIWRAFGNQYWPALYFIDASGRIRQHQFGEGDYERAEIIIQQLLMEAGNREVPSELVSVSGSGPEAPPDVANLQSPENYLGGERTVNFASPATSPFSKRPVYTAPEHLNLNHWALAGGWTIRRNSVVLSAANGKLVYRFHARDLHLVMGPVRRGVPVRFRVRIDGMPPGPAHGDDVDASGHGVVTEQRLYQLIRQPLPIVDRLFEIEFLDPGAEAFSFTFG